MKTQRSGGDGELQVDAPADEPAARTVAREAGLRPGRAVEPRYQAGLGQDLRAVADAEHRLAGRREFPHDLRQRVVRSDGAGADAVFVREPAR